MLDQFSFCLAAFVHHALQVKCKAQMEQAYLCLLSFFSFYFQKINTFRHLNINQKWLPAQNCT